MRPNTASIAEMVSAALFPVSRAASVTRDFRSCKTSTGRVHLQMMRSPSQWPASPRLSMVFGRSWIDARSLMASREALATRATAFVATRQITPQGRGLLCGPIDEGVDCLAADGPQPRFIPGFQPTGDLFGRPSLGEPVPHEQT